MKQFKVFLILVTWSATGTRAQDCPEVDVLQQLYVQQNVLCNTGGTLLFYVYEDCPNGAMIFSVSDGYTIHNCTGVQLIVSEGSQFGLSPIGDAENSKTQQQTCSRFLEDKNSTLTYSGIFTFVDVNEYPPQPANDLDIVESINVLENVNGSILDFGYIDLDAEETKTLEVSYNFQGDDEIFDIVEIGQNGSVMNYQLVANDFLDFETNSFYSFEATFTSSDTRMNSSSVVQNFLVFVQDVGDNPPIFTSTDPVKEMNEEEPEGTLVFTVEAQDRDVNINNDIMYSITGGNEAGYFAIDNSTGDVFIANTIDRDTLESTSFALQIQAMEVLQDGSQAPEPSTSSQVTSVNILDINDNIPTIEINSTSTQVEEFSEVQPVNSRNIDVVFTVTDLDEGLSGEYKLTTTNENVKLNPTSGSGQTVFGISILNSDDFNYELRDDPNIVVEITATETGNNTHVSTVNLTIILVDINDKIPTFGDDPYSFDLYEDTVPGTTIVNASATDDDASPEFGEEFLVYSISGCDEVKIDEDTGAISLSDTLDYEQKTLIECTLTVADMNDTSEDSLSSQSSLQINILDVNDEVPEFINFVTSVDVVEDSAIGTEISTVHVTDPDTNASLVVSMEYAPGTPQEVQEWFQLTPNNGSTVNNYTGKIVIVNSPDREMTDQVVVNLRAIDEYAETANQETIRKLTITIEDINDETPQFNDDYSQLHYYENTSKGTLVLIVSATDPDVDDELTYILKDDLSYLQINETTGEISVLNPVDREEVASFQVELTVVDLANHTGAAVQIDVTVDDKNDNAPHLDDDVCGQPLSIAEDEADGVILTTVVATDEDEGIHAEIVYVLKNPNTAGSVYQDAPFIIESQSGVITVNTSGDRYLDWERLKEWQLTVDAYDQCDDAELSTCTPNSDECVLTVAVVDVNDNPPGDYSLNTGTKIITNEFLMQGEPIPDLEISALDPDEPNTEKSQISFQVSLMTLADGTETEVLFEAKDGNRTSPGNITEYFCNLVATRDLTGLRNDYIIEIQGSDAGEPPFQSAANFSLTIQDSNDMVPEMTYSECLEENNYTIVILENKTDVYSPLPCNYNDSDAEPADIFATDDDAPGTDNSKVDLKIIYEESIAEDGGPDNQLSAFYVYRYNTSDPENRFAIAVSENIDRERGSQYSLRVVAQDRGNVPQASYTWIYITVMDLSEFLPTFCQISPCEQTLYIKENTNVSTPFLEAQDLDNGDDTINDIIYYTIIEDSASAFVIRDITVPAIMPIVPLDREGVASYNLLVMASNSPSDDPPDGVPGTNQVLNIEVIILDENDESPTYAGVIYGDFLDSGNKDDLVAILEFEDKDLNETITYSFKGDFHWSDGQNFADPFRIEVIDNRTSKIVLNMGPEGKYGYCSFNVVAEDKASHNSTALTQVFVVTNEYIVLFFFLNDIEDVQQNEDNIEDIFTDVFNYTCVIDSIDKSVDSNNAEIDGETVVSAHFIQQLNVGYDQRKILDNTKRTVQKKRITTRSATDYTNPLAQIRDKYSEENSRNYKPEGGTSKELQMEKEQYPRDFEAIEAEYQLVPEEEIEEMGSKGTVASELKTNLDFLGLTLVRIGDTSTNTGPDYEQKITNLKIAIGSVALFLGLVALLLIILYFVQTTKLKRQLKSYSTKTVAATDEARGEEAFPGSNLYTAEKANPMYNVKDDAMNEATNDNESIASWDSVLVGVEDNPQFAESLASKSNASSEETGVILEPSFPNPFMATHKTNPLIDNQGNSGLLSLQLETQSVHAGSSVSADSEDGYNA